MPRDEYAYILEYLPYGMADSKERRPSAIILTDSLGLLLVVLKKDVKVEPGQKVYIGEDKREEVHHIVERISPDKLSAAGMQLLTDKLHQIILENEKKYVDLINKLGPINVRIHAISLIPGMGKKTSQKLLLERSTKPFESYNDIKERAGLSTTVDKAIEDRIMEELYGKDKYRIFT
ncbi:MAG: DUF655 domain-containing protein [Candidatus Parvarchaeota archaeon]|jgi:putative nucleotide binding protein|nr:DUF655 domain-containing protein [Candidatus Parvarchaeota archaeon]